VRALRLERCQELLGYQFGDLKLLQQALTHSSDKTSARPDNERLEFLGDSILGILVSDHLYRTCKKASEGELTQMKSRLVSRQTLARIARRMQLSEHLIVGKGVLRQSAGAPDKTRIPPSILSGALEAVIAAIYLDGGMKAARKFVLGILSDELEETSSGKPHWDYKSLLQQLTQRQMQLPPTYKVIDAAGPDHNRRFRVAAVIGGKKYAEGEGRSKKQAEQEAARKAYTILAGQN